MNYVIPFWDIPIVGLAGLAYSYKSMHWSIPPFLLLTLLG